MNVPLELRPKSVRQPALQTLLQRRNYDQHRRSQNFGTLNAVPLSRLIEAMHIIMHLRSSFPLLALWRPRTLASPTMDTTWSNVQQPLAPQRDLLNGDDTVILGAGVIGLATAYQLALAHRETANATTRLHGRIIVVERAAHISPAASGQATGGLGDFGFASGVADLGALSYRLFQELALANGVKEFGFSESTIYRIIPEDFTGTPKPPDTWGPSPPSERPVSALPDWIKPRSNWSVQRIAGPSHASHLYVRVSIITMTWTDR